MAERTAAVWLGVYDKLGAGLAGSGGVGGDDPADRFEEDLMADRNGRTSISELRLRGLMVALESTGGSVEETPFTPDMLIPSPTPICMPSH